MLGNIAKKSKESYQLKFLKLEIAARKNDNTLDDFVDVTNFVRSNGIGRLSKSIDTNDFTIGLYDQNNMTILLDNSSGFFNSNSGLFENRIENRSKVRVTAGYFDNNNLPITNTNQIFSEITFEGVISAEGAEKEAQNETVSYKVLSYISIMKSIKARSGVVTTGMTFQTAIFNLLNTFEITQYLTVDISNINPYINLTIDDPSPFEDIQLDEAINYLLLFSNSIFDIQNNEIIVKPRIESSEIKFQFYGKGSNFPSNIISITNHNPGQRRVITRIKFPFVSIPSFESSAAIQDRFGSKIKEINFPIVTDTSKLQTIANLILDEFQFPKTEFKLTTSYIGESVNLLDLVTIDNTGYVFDVDAARYGTAVYGTATYYEPIAGLKIYPNTGFKILSIEHDYTRFTTTLKLREIGKGLFDGTIDNVGSFYGNALYGVSKYG